MYILDLAENSDSKEMVIFFSYSLSVFVYASTYAKCFIPVSEPVLRTFLKTFIRNWLNRENDVLSFLPDSTRKER